MNTHNRKKEKGNKIPVFPPHARSPECIYTTESILFRAPHSTPRIYYTSSTTMSRQL